MRPQEEREKLTYSHVARLLSDCVSYIALVAVCISHVLGKPKADFEVIFQEAESLFKQLRKFTDDYWMCVEQDK
jgi:hypothetical protein